MKTAQLLALVACIILASCATMKNADTRPTEGPCVEKYDLAKIGEKEALAGVILLPSGLVLGAIGLPLMGVGWGGNEAAFFSGIGLAAVSLPAMIVGLITIYHGNRRVDDWNKNCVGATAAERYCLFEPLPILDGETP